MDEIITAVPEGLAESFKDYRAYKKTLDTEIKANAEGFVRIGYLLKVARDTDILRESGYDSLTDFAHAEYGITKDIVSRYIAINDRYSENGYSDRLQLKYEGYGVAKLAEMLTLPDEVIEEINPSLTKREIQEIKKEIAEEEKITPIEVAIEAAAPAAVKDESEYTYIQRIWKSFFKDNKDLYRELGKNKAFMAAFEEVRTDAIDKKAAEALLDILAPNGDTVLWARIPGVGKVMISVHADELEFVYTNTRTNEKKKGAVHDAEEDIHEIFGACDAAEYQFVYGEPLDTVTEKKAEAPKEEGQSSAPVREAKGQGGKAVENAANRQQEDEKDGRKAAPDVGKCIDENNTENAEAEQAGRGSDMGMNPPETQEVAPVQQEKKLEGYKTKPLKGCLDVGYNDRLINTSSGEIVTVLGQVAGMIKVAPEVGGVFTVSAPNDNGWEILLEEPEEKREASDGGKETETEEAKRQQDEQEEAKGQQDTETASDEATRQQSEQEDEGQEEDPTRGLSQRIFDKEREFEEVFEDAYADGLTLDGLRSVIRQAEELTGMLKEMLYHKNSEDGMKYTE